MKDKDIQEIFDNYADTLEPQTHLSQKARESMMPSQGARKKPPVRWYAWALCAAVVLVVVLGAVALPIFGDFSNSVPEQITASYTMSEVSATNVSSSDVKSYIPLERLTDNGYRIVFEKYRAYYFTDSDQIAFVTAELGVSTANGIVEVHVTAESGSFVRNDLSDYFHSYISSADSLSTVEDTSLPGEYVTSAFFNANGLHFYVYVQGSLACSKDAQTIAKLFS